MLLFKDSYSAVMGFKYYYDQLTIFDPWVDPPSSVNWPHDVILKMQYLSHSYHTIHTYLKTYLKLCFRDLFAWPCWARSAGSKIAGDNAGHRSASSLYATAQTPADSPGPYNSRSAPPSGQAQKKHVLKRQTAVAQKH